MTKSVKEPETIDASTLLNNTETDEASHTDEEEDGDDDEEDESAAQIEDTLEVINNYFSEVFAFKVDESDASAQTTETLEYLQKNCWVKYTYPDGTVSEELFDYEGYSTLLEAYVHQMSQYLNLMLQHMFVDKMGPPNASMFQTSLKASAFWKLMMMSFASISRLDTKIAPSWEHEISGCINVHDYLPSNIKEQMREYLEHACTVAYKTSLDT